MQDIESWLAELGLGRYADVFADAEIEWADLAYLSDDDLKEMALPIGPRRRIKEAIKKLAAETGADTAAQQSQSNTRTDSEPARKVSTASASEAERRQLTVMFVDLVGSTAMATTHDAEDIRNVITSYQNTVAGIVSRHDGFVARYMGDGVLCYFGWPRANEDDAERSVRAGLEIIAQVRKLPCPTDIVLATRIGIATGVVIVGDLIGTGAAQEAAVVGETPNLASRLQGIAKPDELVVAEETQRLLGNRFELVVLANQQLKGISHPIDVYRVAGEAIRESRFHARHSATLPPIVGRNRDIELMLEHWTLAKSAQGQMVLVTGEAGIGKSRITRAVLDEIEKDDYIRITYQCSPYHAESALYPVIQHLSFAAGIAASDSPDTRMDKLEALLGSDPDTLKLITPMMGLDGSARYGTPYLAPAQQRARTLKSLVQLMVRQAEIKPVLLVYEDLHWIDPTSLELIDLLLDSAANHKIMLLATARPGFEYAFGGHPIVTRITLNRLGKEQIRDIASELIGGNTLADEVLAIIAERTDGVPLFVEELTKTILESGVLKDNGDRLVLNRPLGHIAIPTTLHDSLMARLDRLQPIKEVAQMAACIGREFSHGLLRQISLLPEAELRAALDGLIGAELVYRRGVPPEASYLFKHALVRDTAYESQLKEKRRTIHARILTALELDTDVAPEILAVHAEAANLTDRAIDLWETAGEAAIGRPAFDEGMAHLRHAISLLRSSVDKNDRASLERCVRLQVRLSYASMARYGWGDDRTKAALEQALALTDVLGDTPLRFQILYGLMTTRYLRGDNVEAVHHGQLFVDLAEKAPETMHAVVANRSFAISLMFNGQLKRAQTHFERALTLFDPALHSNLAHKYGMDLGVGTHGLISNNLVMLGQTRRAIKLLRECEHYAQVCEDITSKGYMHMVAGFSNLLMQDLTELSRHTKCLADLASQYNLSLFGDLASLFSSLLVLGNGDPAGLEKFTAVDASLAAAHSLGALPIIRTEAGYRALALGLDTEAMRLADSAQELIAQTGEELYLSELYRLYAALAQADGNAKVAEQRLGEALVVARNQSAKLFELRVATDLARIWQTQGRSDDATSTLKLVSESIAEGECSRDQAAAKELLSELTV